MPGLTHPKRDDASATRSGREHGPERHERDTSEGAGRAAGSWYRRRVSASEQRWIRSQRAAVVELGDGAVALVARDGRVLRLDEASADMARAVVAYLGQPRSEREVIAHLEVVAGEALGERVEVVRQLLAVLADTGAVSTSPAAAGETRAAGSGLNIVVGISGAIAASFAPGLVGALQRRGHTVELCVTPTAQRFVALDALTAIVQREVGTSMWPRTAHAPVPHVALAAWADLVIVYPASGTTIARIAHGEFSELVAAVALTTRAPVVLVPSMNAEMLASASVQRNLEQLREDGFVIVHGVPSHEVADAPSVRESVGGAAPAPSEVVATIEALRAAGVLHARTHDPPGPRAWEAVYRKAGAAAREHDGERHLLPWASETCDADIASALAEHAPRGALLDVGCGLGQVARHAARAGGYRVVATDVSESALALARDLAPDDDIVWVRDDTCASGLVGPFDVIVDRATLHTLSPVRAYAWAATIKRITRAGSVVIVKAHRDGVPPATRGMSGPSIAALLPDFAIVAKRDAQLPGLVDANPIASVLVVLRRT
jgi:3-polyprenyl-4-hydroxybenzoate decarboxylase/SAM-dependent methyltransferase